MVLYDGPISLGRPDALVEFVRSRLNYTIFVIPPMPRNAPVQVFRDESPDLEARIIAAIGDVGPRNVARIARMTKVHQETIRYKMKKRFPKLGFRFHADVDYGKLGLSLHWGTLHFASPHYDSASQIFRLLNKVGYLTYYAKILPQGHHVALFALPRGSTEQYTDVLSRLQERGILKGFDLQEVVANRHAAMDPEFFNFRSGRWEVEWEKLRSRATAPLRLAGSVKAHKVDLYDLLLIKEFQKDATQHVVEIAKDLKVDPKTLEYHYRTHVSGRKLIRSYYVRWTRDIEKTLAHSVATTRLTFRNLDSRTAVKAQSAIERIPFLWAEELLRDGTYVATLNIPVEEMIATQAYINGALLDLGTSVEIGFVKPKEASSFTIPYELFREGAWEPAGRAIESNLLREYSKGVEK